MVEELAVETSEDTPDSIADAMEELKKLLNSAKSKNLNDQSKLRHESVLMFLELQHSKHGKPLEDNRRMVLAGIASRAKGKGEWFARHIVKWEKSWIASRTIPEGRIGCKGNLNSWLKDEGLLLFVREWIGKSKDGTCDKSMTVHC